MMEKNECLKWHVLYTMPKAERRVASSIRDMNIESYLPLHTVIRQWSDRKKKIEVPLFPNYVFVKVDEKGRRLIFDLKEQVKFIQIDNRPVVVNEKEIAMIKQVLSGDVNVCSEEYFQQGMSVRIKQGQFAGLEGVVMMRNGSTRLLVRIDGLQKAFSFNISAAMVEPLAATV